MTKTRHIEGPERLAIIAALTAEPDAPYKAIGQRFGRSINSIALIARREGLTRIVDRSKVQKRDEATSPEKVGSVKLAKAMRDYAVRYQCIPMLSRIMAYEARAGEVRA